MKFIPLIYLREGINRYYILTTYNGSFESIEMEHEINNLIIDIKKSKNIEIIANGIVQSLKYYLRFIEDYNSFLNNYTMNLISDSKISTEIRASHISKWFGIIEKFKIEINITK
jgi:DNA (cytosine-5)-methyltransferase 1